MPNRPIHLDPPDPVQGEIFRKMTGGERILAAADLYRAVRRMLCAHVSDEHPDWSRSQVEAEVTKRMTRGNR